MARLYRGLASVVGMFALEAQAHGGNPPWIGAALLIALSGVLACIVVALATGFGPMLARLGIGVALAVVDFLAWIALIWSFQVATRNPVDAPEWMAWTALTFLLLFPWIIPAEQLVRARIKRAGRP